MLVKKFTKKHDFNQARGESKANEHQSEVRDALQSAFDALSHGRYEQAHDAIDQGMSLVNKRSKLIILADNTAGILLRNIKEMKSLLILMTRSMKKCEASSVFQVFRDVLILDLKNQIN